ncbi:lauroyl acyltransferase [Roseovarius faecimaris]|uniref:Lauroyl acyltransferase n=1 Tax=Roseovarius faecimaris TaxID=2494550 RepID=A0A6I6IR06_9RHOB|nr:lysophospholipid acyltransferase family protein [Roseovarius faecimaris]QGX98514.1 lauroyl acyltransferase [Roseovarius faecimaris]
MSDTSDHIPLTERFVGMVLYAPIALARTLPYRWRIPVAGWLTAHVLAPLAGYRRRVRDNLAHACPDLPAPERRRLMRAVPDNAGRNMMEMYSPEFREAARHLPVSGPGLPTLRAAREAGRPVVFVTGHFGNFNAARVAMIEQGFHMGGFYRPMKNRPFNRHYMAAMRSVSEPLFEQGRKGMTQMVRHLRSGGVVAVLNDLNAHDGVPLTFFGQPALTSLATAEMALKYDAPLIPVWGIRNPDGRSFHVVVEDEIAPSDAVTMTQEFNDRLEAQVRAHMDQWFWIHRRWKDGSGPLHDKRAEALAKMQNR